MAQVSRWSWFVFAGVLAACGGTTVSGTGGGTGGAGAGGNGGTTDAAAGSAGTAGTGHCPIDHADCNGDKSDGCETNIGSDPANCGFCGHTCSVPHSTAACVNGMCNVAVCDTGYANCDAYPENGCETNIESDPQNCGSCGTQCPSNNGGPPTCNAGSCIQMCCDQPGFALCSGDCSTGSCADLMNDPQNCGGCGHVCPTAGAPCANCVNGVCGLPGCTPPTADCDCIASNGCETDLQTDPKNCGACGNACASGQSCVSGSCQ